MQAFIWAPELTTSKEAPQLGPSSCGATAVLNVLVSAQPIAMPIKLLIFFNFFLS